jgi:hypothetical protein
LRGALAFWLPRFFRHIAYGIETAPPAICDADATASRHGDPRWRMREAGWCRELAKDHAWIDRIRLAAVRQEGNYVSVGGALMAVVPLSEIYVDANYREVQLRDVRAGQRARIHVDAYNIDLEGSVVGVPAASGATFATLQPDNATGNFTKIVQRLPIKIVLAPHQPAARLLRVGLSVEATIDTRPAGVVTASR